MRKVFRSTAKADAVGFAEGYLSAGSTFVIVLREPDGEYSVWTSGHDRGTVFYGGWNPPVPEGQ